MANDPGPGLRKELEAAIEVLTPQIRGLEDFTKVSVSDKVAVAMSLQIQRRGRRHQLIMAVLAALDAVLVALDELFADGYPDMPDAEVPGDILEEISEQIRDLQVAAGLFGILPMAAQLKIKLGASVPKAP